MSCDTFGGFKRTIEINDCNSKQDVINRMICLLEQFLNNEDLYKLKTKLESIKLIPYSRLRFWRYVIK